MDQPAETKAVRVRIEGRVQGVWFRAWTSEQARARGLSGWVRNRRDGSVEAVFAGDARKVDDMVAACRQGPPMARVHEVTVSAAEDPGGGFDFRPTA
jgi:acylphosphatase